MDYKNLSKSPPPYSEGERATSPYETQLLQTAPPPQPVVVNTTTVVLDGQACPKCHARVHLTVKRHPTCRTYCLAAVLCLFLCWPCVCLPCCCDCCYRTSQFCPNCNASLGSF